MLDAGKKALVDSLKRASKTVSIPLTPTKNCPRGTGIEFGAGALGFRIRSVNSEHQLYELVPDGQAEKKGLRTGDAIMGINGQKLDSDVEHATLVAILKQLPRPFTLHMRRAASGKKRLEFTETKIGIDITRTATGAIEISKVTPGSLADQRGIVVGDTLDGVNDIDIAKSIGKPILECDPQELRFWFLDLGRPLVLNLNWGAENSIQQATQQLSKMFEELPQSLSKVPKSLSNMQLSKMQSPNLKALAKKSRKSLANMVTQVQAQARSAVERDSSKGNEVEAGRKEQVDECVAQLRTQDAAMRAMQHDVNGNIEAEGMAPIDADPGMDGVAAFDLAEQGGFSDEESEGSTEEGSEGEEPDSSILDTTLSEMDKSLDCVATSALSEAADIMKLCQEMEQQRESYQLSEMKLTVETLMASKRNLEDELERIDSKFSIADDAAMFAAIDIDDLENAQEGGWERAGTPEVVKGSAPEKESKKGKRKVMVDEKKMKALRSDAVVGELDLLLNGAPLEKHDLDPKLDSKSTHGTVDIVDELGEALGGVDLGADLVGGFGLEAQDENGDSVFSF
jgi:hypothetical protein